MSLGCFAVLVLTSTSGLAVDVRAKAGRGQAESRTEVDRSAIEAAVREGASLADVVARAPGARRLDYGGRLHAQEVALRGGTATQTLIVLDGTRVSSPFALGIDLGLFDLGALERIETIRGGHGARYGDGAIAGVVRLETRAAGPPGGAAQLGFGALDTTSIRARAEAGGWSAALRHERTLGRFDYVSRLEGLPDRPGVRENNGVEVFGGALRGGLPLGPGRGAIFVGLAERRSGVAGLETQPNRTAREVKRSLEARATFEKRRQGGLGIRAALAGGGLTIDYVDPAVGADLSSRFVALAGELELSHVLGVGHLARGEARVAAEGVLGGTWRPSGHLALGDRWALGELELELDLAALLVPEGLVALPRVGATWAANEALGLRLSLGRSARSPRIDERFHPPEAGFEGNPDLVPEIGWELEAGGALELGPLAVDLAGFVRRLDAGILYVNRNAFVVRPENVGGAWVAGGELELGLRLSLGGHGLHALARGALTWSRLDAIDAPLAGRPVVQGGGELGWRPPLPFGLEGYGRVELLGPATANLAGTLEVEPYRRLDVGLRLSPFPGAELTLSVDNVLDDRALETLNKVPLPGRTWFLSVAVRSEGAST